MYISVIFDLPIEKEFTYKVNDRHAKILKQYARIIAPFKNAKKKGVAYKLNVAKPDFDTKEIIDVIDETPLINNNALDLANWMKQHYVCTLGQAVFTMLPGETKEKIDEIKQYQRKQLLILNDEQRQAFDKVKLSIDENRHEAFLLYGVTGSGKTEVYRHIADYLKQKEKITTILVPEISLTPQTIRRFAEIFGERVAVIHSRLNPKEKLYHWKRIQRKEVDVVLGARSAVFAPISNPGCIIIDEEHETSYKSGDTPRYSAKQVAFFLAHKNKIPLVLGSATPQIESYYHALNGRITLLPLKKRFAKEQNKDIEILDISKTKGMFHQNLISSVISRLANNEQTILLLNRRGFTPYILCKQCGQTVQCDNCSVAMTYHKSKNALLCHSCGAAKSRVNVCPECGSYEMEQIGSGTEKIEEILEMTFTGAKIGRMDFDTTRGKKGHTKILDALANKEIDILVGTQMIAKGLHFPNVTLVGVIDSDIALNLPDFRAGERIFSLLMQVSGRAGRGEIKGKVIIQTRSPEHFVIKLAAQENYDAFYEKEIEIREQTLWPPFSRVLRMVLRGTQETYVEEQIIKAVHEIGTVTGVELLGPSPCPLSKVNKYFRYHVILRSDRIDKPVMLAGKYQERFKKDRKVFLEIDTDPLTML